MAGFSTIAAPLIALTRKGVICDTGTDECRAVFSKLKNSLIEAPLLHYVDPQLDFILDTDASATAIGACLAQVGKDENGELYERPVAFASKTLNNSRRRYCTTKRELYSVIYFMRYWRSFTGGMHVSIRTDHNSLRWLVNFGNGTGESGGMYRRWAFQLSQWRYTLTHRPGKDHANADGMSRLVKAHAQVPAISSRMKCPFKECPDCTIANEYNRQSGSSGREPNAVTSAYSSSPG